MARMAASQRLELGDKMVEAWTAAGQGNQKSCLFVQDMLFRMRSGKGMSPKQREWFDSAVATPPPQMQNEALVLQLRNAAEVEGMEFHKQTLLDFARRVGNGWSLTEKQETFMNGLLLKAQQLKEEGPWIPTADERKQIEFVVGVCRRYSSYYLGGRPGLSNSLRNCVHWLNGESKILDKKAAEVVMGACKGERFRASKFAKDYPPGTLVEHFSNGGILTVISEPFPDNRGELVFNALCDGKLVEMSTKVVKK